MIVVFKQSSYVELPTASTVALEGDDLICKQEGGAVVARAKVSGVLAYGHNELLRTYSDGDESSNGNDGDDSIYQRYKRARERFLQIEREHHDVIDEVRRYRDERSTGRLMSLRHQLNEVHDLDYMPRRWDMVSSLLSKEEIADQS